MTSTVDFVYLNLIGPSSITFIGLLIAVAVKLSRLRRTRRDRADTKAGPRHTRVKRDDDDDAAGQDIANDDDDDEEESATTRDVRRREATRARVVLPTGGGGAWQPERRANIADAVGSGPCTLCTRGLGTQPIPPQHVTQQQRSAMASAAAAPVLQPPGFLASSHHGRSKPPRASRAGKSGGAADANDGGGKAETASAAAGDEVGAAKVPVYVRLGQAGGFQLLHAQLKPNIKPAQSVRDIVDASLDMVVRRSLQAAADEGGAVAVNARRTRVARLAEQLQPSAFGVGEQVLLEASWPYLPASHLACVRIIGPELQLADVAV